VLAAVCLLAAACGPRRIAFPTDPGTPIPDTAEIHAKATAACAGVRTLTAELGLSGRAGTESLRGRIIAGFQSPSSMRLEAGAPFGSPVFILAARDSMATLLFPRQSRVVRNASAAAILGAVTGVDLAPADLQAVITGCVVPSPASVTGGRRHANGWTSLDLQSTAGGATTDAQMFFRETAGRLELRAARRGPWEIEYPAWQGTFPQTVRLRMDSPTLNVALTTTLSQIETNMPIDPAAFTIDVPPDAIPLSLDELRETGPLRGN
jgi:hypothetical protein